MQSPSLVSNLDVTVLDVVKSIEQLRNPQHGFKTCPGPGGPTFKGGLTNNTGVSTSIHIYKTFLPPSNPTADTTTT